jgi:hypothetical protein
MPTLLDLINSLFFVTFYCLQAFNIVIFKFSYLRKVLFLLPKQLRNRAVDVDNIYEDIPEVVKRQKVRIILHNVLYCTFEILCPYFSFDF